MKSFFIATLILSVTVSCGYAFGKRKPAPTPAPVQPCVVQRINGGVKITCPTSEEIVYDGATGQVGPQGEQGKTGAAGSDGQDGVDGTDGTSCTVDNSGLVRCGNTTYQLPVATEEECQVFILPKE